MRSRDTTPTPFVLGGSWRPRFDRTTRASALAIGTVLAVIVIPLRGLYRGTGASMEEGFMLVFPRLVQEGEVANVDFLHLYGPASLDALALWYRVFGDGLESERTFGLLQTVAIIFAIYAICRACGHLVATGSALVATFLILTPIGLTALAWHGGVALALWAVVLLIRGRTTRSPVDWWFAGGLAGLALGFRPDLALGIGIAVGFATWRRPRELLFGAAGAAVGLLPLWFHVLRAGPQAVVDGMLIDPVVRLRPGRELPTPPSWDRIDGALQRVAEGQPPWWRFPAMAAEHQLFVWFFAVVVAAIVVPVVAVVVQRRSGQGPGHPIDALVVAGLFGLGIVPQALQRPDSTHLAWVAVVSWPLLLALVAHLLRRRWSASTSAVAATMAMAVVMFVVCPFFTYRNYLLHSRVAVGDLPVPFVVERNGKQFWVGDPAVARAINAMIPTLDGRAEPGDRLFVGPGDLRRTIYADTYIYWLYSELDPATYYIEMDPGLADRAGSGMAADIASADFVVLTNTWSGWVEPNASSEYGSPEHNQAVADNFCLVESYEDNLVLLFERCEGGGGLNPADVIVRAPDFEVLGPDTLSRAGGGGTRDVVGDGAL